MSKKLSLFLLGLLVIISTLISGCSSQSGGLGPIGQIVPYQDRNFTVSPGQQYTISIDLRQGAVIEGYLTVIGGNNDVRFYIKDSYGNIVLDKNRVTDRYDFSYTAASAGFHTMYFDNSFSIFTGKQVLLHYRVR